MRRLVTVLALTLAITVSLLSCPQPVRAAQGQGGALVEIRPEMELLAGVLTQTSWIQNRGPKGQGNDYFRALKEHFTPFKDHEAVKIAEQLTRKGFTYDAPPAFLVHLGPLPQLELKYEYSAYVVGRGGSREILERFRVALRDLAAESRFLEFFSRWQPQFDQWTQLGAFDGPRITTWLESFFGEIGREFHFILAPAMFPDGGYGATVQDAQGRKVVYQIIREQGQSETEPQFPSGAVLEALATHEWGHSFVNPAVEAHADVVRKMVHLYRPVDLAMRKQAYPNVHIFMNEQVLRAATVLATEEFRGREAAEAEIKAHEKRGFYLTRPAVAVLREYQQQRDKYPAFRQFVPVLLERLKQEDVPFSVTALNLPSSRIYIIEGLVVLALALGIVIFIVRRARRLRAARSTVEPLQ